MNNYSNVICMYFTFLSQMQSSDCFICYIFINYLNRNLNTDAALTAASVLIFIIQKALP